MKAIFITSTRSIQYLHITNTGIPPHQFALSLHYLYTEYRYLTQQNLVSYFILLCHYGWIRSFTGNIPAFTTPLRRDADVCDVSFVLFWPFPFSYFFFCSKTINCFSRFSIVVAGNSVQKHLKYLLIFWKSSKNAEPLKIDMDDARDASNSVVYANVRSSFPVFEVVLKGLRSRSRNWNKYSSSATYVHVQSELVVLLLFPLLYDGRCGPQTSSGFWLADTAI